ncbi:carbonic anhydrase [Adlercreutzia murintestinalis]|uniref:carbonic anhydrase n=1 Tax=Adlercreutzia murintestinalis TaxID=2941325 RepID=UPI002040D533|nr:carbonic anhydrase [Adlercreutzia murintestinalis]
MVVKKAYDAITQLMYGNASYLSAKVSGSDISPALRERLRDEGQKPIAVILTCSDSRVVPEDIFMCGLGELFVVRVAGNVADEAQIASVVYAVEHLGVPLVMVLGHTHCGAVTAVMEGYEDESLAPLTSQIAEAIEGESDLERACCLNALASVERLREVPELMELEDAGKLTMLAALYHIGSGRIEMLDQQRGTTEA